MRLIVACMECNRQFDASGYKLGSRFHCHCGEIVRVAQPEPHEATVVRCSGCGAPRSSGPNCDHCGSSFAMFEQDLTSICPHCVTRVSDRARFCHSCGKALAAEGFVGELSDASCPACGGEQRMHSRKLADELSMMECSGCAGLWLGHSTFEHVVRRAEEMVTQLDGLRGPPEQAVATAFTPQVSYRPCPVCKTLMNRRNYGRHSRVIVDICRQHGIWLDCGELTQILEWVRDGGLERSRKLDHEKRVEELRMQQAAVAMASVSADMNRGELIQTDSVLLSFLRLF